MSMQEVIEKIRKLLNLGASSNENEAQSAMLMAQKLMAQYHIEISQVEDAPVDHTVIEEKADKKPHRTKWKRALASVIAKNFQCEHYMRGHGSYETIFLGKKDNLEICKQVYSASVKFIDIHFALWWNGEGKWDWDGSEKPLAQSIAMKDSYARGFIRKLNEKFEEQKVQAEKEGWGLVLVKDVDVVNQMNKIHFSGTLSNNASSINLNAVQQGYSDCGNKFGETGQKRIGGHE